MAIMNSSKAEPKDDEEVTISRKLFQIENGNDDFPPNLSDCQSSSTPKDESITEESTPENTSTTVKGKIEVPPPDAEIKTAPKHSPTVPPKVVTNESQPSDVPKS